MSGTTTGRRYGVNAGQAMKVPCKVATAGNITLSGEQTIDGVSCTENDRVLVKDQTAAAENGIYDVSSGTWQRSPDWDGAIDVVEGTLIPVNEGTLYSTSMWRVNTSGEIIPGTTAVTIILAAIGSANTTTDLVVGNKSLSNANIFTLEEYHESRIVDAVVDYGANNAGAGVGSTDAHVEINQAIQDVSDAGGGVVRLPAGVYDIGDPIVLAPGVKLQGDGPGITTLRATASISMVTYTSTGTSKTFFNVEGMSIVNNNLASVDAIVITGSSTSIQSTDIRLESLYISGSAVPMDKGIRLKWCANTTIDDVFITVTTNGVEIDICQDTDLSNIKVQNGDGNGFFLQGDVVPGQADEGIRMSNCTTNGQLIGVSAKNVDFVRIHGCSFTTCDSGPIVAQACTNWTVTGCELADAVATYSNPGIVMDSSCQTWTIVGNYIFLSTFGIVLAGTSHVVSNNIFAANTNVDINVTATDCVVSNNVLKSTGTINSIVLQAGSDRNIVTGNTLIGVIVITSSDNNVVMGNVVQGVTAGASVVEQSTANYNLMVQNVLNGTITFVGANSAIDWTDSVSGGLGDGTGATAAGSNKTGNNLIY